MDFASVLESARNGSKPALGTILESCRGYIIQIAKRRIPSKFQGRIRPSSLVGETYLRACRNFGSRFDGCSEGQVRAWLRTILLHCLIDELRKLGVRPDPSSLPPEVARDADSPVDRAAGQELSTAFGQALGRLTDRERRAVELRYFDRLGFREIGVALGCSAEAARKVWVRAQIKIGGELEPFR